jgi:hypothetical protein
LGGAVVLATLRWDCPSVLIVGVFVAGAEVVAENLLELEGFRDDLLLVVTTVCLVELVIFAEDLVELEGLTRTEVEDFELEIELPLVVDLLLVKIDEDFTVVLLLIFLLLLLLIFLVLLTTFEKLIVFFTLDVENLEVDVGFEVEAVYLLEVILLDGDVDLRLEGNGEVNLLLEKVISLLEETILSTQA